MKEERLESIRYAVEKGRSKDAEKYVRLAIEEQIAPADILHGALIPAMKHVGNIYQAEEIDIPRILSAARGVRRSMDVLEPYIKDDAAFHVGEAIIGTVEGDLHEVGKNLVAIMFRSAGFTVIDLGVDVSEKQFLKAVRDNPKARIVCISSLLTTAIPKMRRTVRALRSMDKQHRLCIMVGGGSVTGQLAEEVGADVYTENAALAAEAAKRFVTQAGKEMQG